MTDLERQAEAGDAEAQYVMGMVCEHGQGVAHSVKTAKSWYGKACQNGHKESCKRFRQL